MCDWRRCQQSKCLFIFITHQRAWVCVCVHLCLCLLISVPTADKFVDTEQPDPDGFVSHMEQTSNVHMRMKAFGVVRPSSDAFGVVFAIKRSDRKKVHLHVFFFRQQTCRRQRYVCACISLLRSLGKADDIQNVTSV